MAAGRQVAVAAALVAAAAAACKRDNPLYCEQEGECQPGWECDVDRRECIFHGRDASWDGEGCADSTRCPPELPICSPEHECQACAGGGTGDADCAGRDPALPICRDDGRCVECLDAGGCPEANAAFCDEVTGQCRGCVAHDECGSLVCNFGQACADPASVVYVDNASGTDAADCGTMASPCASIGQPMGGLAKVGPGRRTVRIAGGQSYLEALVLDGISAVLVGPGVMLQPVVAEQAAIEAINGASVTIDGLVVSGGDGAANGDGVRCGGDGTVVRIERAEVSDNDDVGVEVEAGCDLRMSRTRVARNLGGGVRVASDSYEIVNSAITGNGGGASGLGGLRLVPPGAGATQRLELTTITGNTTGSGASGIQCGTAFTGSSLIVWGNTGGGAQLAAMCSVTYSDVEGGADGTGNLDADPLLDADGFHITTGSPCIDTADPALTTALDVDGDARPLGAGRDIGADELE